MSDMINKEAAARICEEMEKDHAETPVGSAGQWLLQAAKHIRALPSSQWRPSSEPPENTRLVLLARSDRDTYAIGFYAPLVKTWVAWEFDDRPHYWRDIPPHPKE